MGNFIYAMIILVLIVGFTAVNSFIICGICEDINALIDKGDIDCATELWREKRLYISLFVRDAEIDAADTAAEAAFRSRGLKQKPPKEYMQFKTAIAEVRHSEMLCWESIF